MTSLFDLLNRHSEEDFEDLKEAFRKAVEANRKTQAQLDAIIRGCAILRDMREGESHRHTPRLERQPFFVTTAAVAVLALVFGGGLLLGDALTESGEGAKVAGVMARGPPMIAAAQPPAPTGTTEQEEPPGKVEGAVVPSIAPLRSAATGAAESGDVAGNIQNGQAPSLPGSGVEVAKVTEDTGAAIDQPDVKTSADEVEKSARIELPGQNRNQDMAGAVSTIATVQSAAPTGTTEQEPPGKIEGTVVPSIAPLPSAATGAAARGDVAGNAENGPAPSLPGSGVELAKVEPKITGVAIDQPDVKTSADEVEKSARIEPPGQNQNQDMAGASLGAAERHDVAGNTENAPAPGLRGSGVEVAKVTEDTRAAIDQPDVKTRTDQLKKSEGIEEPDQNNSRARSSGVELSSLERDNIAPQPPSSDLVPEKKHRMKTPDTKTHGKPQTVAIRQIQNHNPSACSGSASCPSKVSPLLGVGF